MVANQTECSRQEQICHQIFGGQVKFTEEYMMCTEEQVLVKKKFTNELNMRSPQQT